MKPLILPYKTPIGFYFYETQRNEIVVVNEELYKYICDLMADEMSEDSSASENTLKEYGELVSAGYLKSSYIRDIEHTVTPLLRVALDRKLERILLQVTQNCNLRCDYCVYSESKNLNTRSHSQNFMTFETAKKAIDFYVAHSIDSEEKTIGFYGGEPLLNFKLIKEAIEYANKVFHGCDLRYSVTTNATLLNDEIIDFFIENDVQITVSLDGPKSIHDLNRHFANGSGTYDIVINNLKKLKEKSTSDIPFTISMVIDPDNDYAEIVKIFDVPVMDKISGAIAIVEENEVTKTFTPDYYSKFEKDMFWGLLNEFRERKAGSQSLVVRQQIEQMMEITDQFKTNILPLTAAPAGPCIPGKMRLFIDCFGNLYPCERVSETADVMKIGTVNTGFDLDKIYKLLNIAQLTEKECKNCWAFQQCSVCAKYAIFNNAFCKEKKILRCKTSKNNAYMKILQKTLLYENQCHERKMYNTKGRLGK